MTKPLVEREEGGTYRDTLQPQEQKGIYNICLLTFYCTRCGKVSPPANVLWESKIAMKIMVGVL